MEVSTPRDQKLAPEKGDGVNNDAALAVGASRALVANARTEARPTRLVTPTHLPVGPRKKHTRLLISATNEVGDSVEKMSSYLLTRGRKLIWSGLG